MKLIESTKNKITKAENGKNVCTKNLFLMFQINEDMA